ncbi:hypothetical protein [Winogradskyella sp. 3972H.M.0a.05]|uniref:hypothetical protein n=1 Tax=Winogradskyella sp. 3972H.M.0a.05 TaxID=2950277 RepID=UPI003398B3D7
MYACVADESRSLESEACVSRQSGKSGKLPKSSGNEREHENDEAMSWSRFDAQAKNERKEIKKDNTNETKY